MTTSGQLLALLLAELNGLSLQFEVLKWLFSQLTNRNIFNHKTAMFGGLKTPGFCVD